jgi:predicted dehydrogenase
MENANEKNAKEKNGRVLNVGIVGLGFGAEFIPIYQQHPNATMYAICDQNAARLDEIGDRFGITARYRDYQAMLDDDQIDVIHVNTPPMLHAEGSVRALEAGKHVGSTIPMALSVEDCHQVVTAAERTGLVYMMMETALYGREFLYLKQLYEQGELGRVQFLRAAHHQDMSGWPSYWEGLPPFYNGTHAVSPALGLCGNEAEYVECVGSGRVFDRMQGAYGSPFAVESTHIAFKDSDLAAEVTRHLWATARQYCESFDVYGSIRSFEWAQVEGEKHLMHLGETPERITVPDFADRLPAEIRPFTTGGVYSGTGDAASRAFQQGGGHSGSHPHLVHGLISAILGEAEPYPDAVRGANITCTGILAHESALAGGERKYLPEWTFAPGNAPTVIALDQGQEPPWSDKGWPSAVTGHHRSPTGV